MSESRYYRVSPKFWSDPEVLRWSDDARLLALYLLTCEHRTTEGLFLLKKKYVEADLGWSTERFTKGFGELLEAGFIEYDDEAQVCLIVNALRYQAPQNENQAKNAVKRLAELPPTPLTSTFKRLAEQFSERLAEQLPEGFGEWYGNPQYSSSTSSSTSKPVVPTGPAEPNVELAEQKRKQSKEQALAQRHLASLSPVLGNGKAFDLLHEFKEIWPLAWNEAAQDGLNPKAVGINLLGNFIATVTSTEPNWPRAGQLVSKFGRLALLGIDEGIIANAEDPYRYAFRVCQNRATEQRAMENSDG